jgi:hypothetical protein
MTMEAPVANVTDSAATEPLCWICEKNKADSGEHKTKRSDLLAVLGKPSQGEPFFYHDLHKRNRPVGSLERRYSSRRCASAPTATTPARNRTTSLGRPCRTGCGHGD